MRYVYLKARGKASDNRCILAGVISEHEDDEQVEC